MAKRLFVTGTDTEIGKTWVASSIVARLNQRGIRAGGFKPVASGCVYKHGELRNEDAELLQAVMTACKPPIDYLLINPFAFEPAVAPHFAAQQEGKSLSVDAIEAALWAYEREQIDTLIIEGAGGWLLPLNSQQTMADFVLRNDIPVLLIVGLKLGCINHALLTAQAIKQQGGQLMGWVGNCIDPDMQFMDENIQELDHRMPAPCLGVVPWIDGVTAEHRVAAVSALELPLLDELIEILPRR